ncbi:SirB1 family protein [Avibacterium avium]|uniref:SirB1 family protein n=1 Tax=Avibacterium avium TaxID=751 RepID=UPI003BF89833
MITEITNRTAIYYEMINFYRVINDLKTEDLQSVYSTMFDLLTEAQSAIAEGQTDKEKVQIFFDLVYNKWGFQCDYNDNMALENYCLPDILNNRRGVAVSVGGIILFLAEKLALPIYATKMVHHFILQDESGDEIVFIDPWNGRVVSDQYVEKLYKEVYGDDIEFDVQQLGRADAEDLEDRYAQLAKNALFNKEALEQSLKYIENLLARTPDSIFERRDRGVVLVQLGLFDDALEDLECFVENMPNDPFSELMRSQLPQLRAEIEKKKKTSIH